MSSYGRYNSQSYAPSAPELPPPSNYTSQNTNYTQPPPPSYNNYTQPPPPSSNYNHPHNYPPSQVSSSGYPPSSSGYPPSSSSGYSNFPPGTNQDVIRSFQMVDRDRSGFIDDRELQQGLSSSFHSFNLRTIRLLMFLFKHPHESLRIGKLLLFLFFLILFFLEDFIDANFLLFVLLLIGPKEFTELWNCLGHWRVSLFFIL